MNGKITRREFLKLGGLALGGLALSYRPLGDKPPFLPPLDQETPLGLGRVTTELIYLYSEASFRSQRVGKQQRDDLIWIFEEVTSQVGPAHNPLWYRTQGGYVHSGYVQRWAPRYVEPLESLPPNGALGEISVPFTRALYYTRADGWQELYRLYYQSVHHITGIEEGPDGIPMYRITDHLINVDYHAPVFAVRPIPEGEYAPLATGVPRDEKRIEISIASQALTAYEGDQIVLTTKVATGKHTDNLPEGELPTDTPTGSFRIRNKIPSRHMGDGNLTSDYMAYELPGVPWTMIFHEAGIALHGTYWHNNFGTKMSHGCVNLPNAAALWLFRWTEPVYDLSDWYKMGEGTLVQIVEG